VTEDLALHDLYCKVFVAGARSCRRITTVIHRHLGARDDGHCLSTEVLEIDVRRNDDSDPNRYAALRRDFVFSPYCLDIEPISGAPRAQYVADVSRLLQGLWAEGWDAIAACDFEEDLPRKGGLERAT
jgi:hypothetical protein